MKQTIVEYSGLDNFKKLTFDIDTDTKQHHFNTEFIDVEFEQGRSLKQIFADHLAARTGTVEVLYSGGLDSELVLASCLVNKIPVRAITLRLLIDNVVTNTHDLYYAERYCRHNDIEQKIVDLHVDKFYEQGLHLKYLEPYLNKEFHVATHLWLLEQCTGYAVVGGYYPWPWHHGPKVISPVRATYSFYDRFMRDNAIWGIGNMQNHSLESVILFLQAHVNLTNILTFDDTGLARFRQQMSHNLGFDLEPRIRSYGWNTISKDVFDKDSINRTLIEKFGSWTQTVTWGKQIAHVLGGEPGTWDRFD